MKKSILKKLKVAVKGHPDSIVGLVDGKPVITVKTSRAAVSGLKNFMSSNLVAALQGLVSNPKELEVMEAALDIIRVLDEKECTDFQPSFKNK